MEEQARRMEEKLKYWEAVRFRREEEEQQQ